jgi:hypothetical protein
MPPYRCSATTKQPAACAVNALSAPFRWSSSVPDLSGFNFLLSQHLLRGLFLLAKVLLPELNCLAVTHVLCQTGVMAGRILKCVVLVPSVTTSTLPFGNLR